MNLAARRCRSACGWLRAAADRLAGRCGPVRTAFRVAARRCRSACAWLQGGTDRAAATCGPLLTGPRLRREGREAERRWARSAADCAARGFGASGTGHGWLRDCAGWDAAVGALGRSTAAGRAGMVAEIAIAITCTCCVDRRLQRRPAGRGLARQRGVADLAESDGSGRRANIGLKPGRSMSCDIRDRGDHLARDALGRRRPVQYPGNGHPSRSFAPDRTIKLVALGSRRPRANLVIQQNPTFLS